MIRRGMMMNDHMLDSELVCCDSEDWHHDIEMLTRENMIIQYPSHRHGDSDSHGDAHCNYGAAQSLESESRCLPVGAVYHEL